MHYPPWTALLPAAVVPDGVLLRSRAASTSTTCLPSSLLSLVPQCAVACIQLFAESKYPGATCSATSDLEFLCTEDNTSDLTIGEAGLQCVVSFCTGQNQLQIGVYNVCAGIAGAQPETARTITATLFGTSTTAVFSTTSPSKASSSLTSLTVASSTMESLPPSVTPPTSTEQLSMIVMAPPSTTTDSAAPVTFSSGVDSSSLLSPSPATTSTPQTTSLSSDTSGREASKPVLSTAQIAGIAVGGVAIALAVFALLMLMCWMRRRRQARRRSQRRSRLVEAAPPSEYQSPPKQGTPTTFSNVSSTLNVPTTGARFYAPQQPSEEKRRSFWRRSIRPEEIGVAVSPKAPGPDSPMSASSQQSLTRLLPTAPKRALWPAPLNVEAMRERRTYSQRPPSDATLLDEEVESKVDRTEAIMVDNQPFILEKPPLAKRQRTVPAPLKLPVVPEDRTQTPTQAVRIPLTPTYDNGNVDLISPPRGFATPPPRNANVAEERQRTTTSVSIPERKLAPSSAHASRDARKSPPAGFFPPSGEIGVWQSPREEPYVRASRLTPAVASPIERHSSISSDFTEIDEDTTPEEVNKQLGLTANPPTPSVVTTRVTDSQPAQASPIKDLRYPSIPRSAAISRQAETLAKPAQLRNPPVRFAGPASQRDRLVRAEASFVQTDTTSSDGYLSDDTIEWPVPPLSNSDSRRTNMTASNLRPSLAHGRGTAPNRGRRPLSQMMSPSLNEMVVSEAMSTKLTVPQRSPSSKARLTPSKSKSGDLYLTVDL
ncbi:hypothetical protein PV08_07161 [Exophiala spinifera]|uniref:Extracellular membrane protein CFEM domain-containing protein n=1 Tax=Exophiala spinifera TaxID=91928 RepID=A0A0D2BSX3_9EURO|nr:uncharacterized protein PV08_07161 [Exophiala spinifera]KIW14379.1 hypothetical protein PV08_07161 [Exophiala spinifera]